MAANQPDPKQQQLDGYRVDPATEYLTTQQGVRVDHTDDALTAGERGPTLLEDFHAREKITHFDHERIPERIVHARGSARTAISNSTRLVGRVHRAPSSCRPRQQTPVFVRFSTVAGSRGSADTVRDVRGFAIKFYTDEGNYDLVGNNMPGVLHPGRHQVPGLGACGETRAAQRDPAGPRRTTPSGTSCRSCRKPLHMHHVAHVGSGDAAQLPHDAGLRRTHVPLGQCPGQGERS